MHEVSVFKTKDILKVQTHLTFSLLIIWVFFFIHYLNYLLSKTNCLNLMSISWLAKVKSAELRISRQGLQ